MLGARYFYGTADSNEIPGKKQMYGLYTRDLQNTCMLQLLMSS